MTTVRSAVTLLARVATWHYYGDALRPSTQLAARLHKQRYFGPACFAAEMSLCRKYCSGKHHCRRNDCIGCAVCKTSLADLQRAAVMMAALAVNCSYEDGTFERLVGPWPAPYHFLDEGIANAIATIVGSLSLLDVGAGSGQYGAYFYASRRAGRPAPAWSGIDGASNVDAFSRTGPPGAGVSHANICDPARREASARVRKDWVMSLEVGEHLPSTCLPAYTALLHWANRRGLLLSWARPGQPGKCHVSPRSPESLVTEFEALGYVLDEAATAGARQNASFAWMRKNFLVLRRREIVPLPSKQDAAIAHMRGQEDLRRRLL